MNCLVSVSQYATFFMIIKLKQFDTMCTEIYAIPHSLKGKFGKKLMDEKFVVTSSGNTKRG